MMKTPEVMTAAISVAIPAYQNEPALAQTLERIFECSPLPSEVLLHFDGGWVPARDFSVGAPVPVRTFCSEINVGPGGGRHRLIQEARNDLVACFDDDSWPLDSDYFAKAVQVMAAFPNAAILSPAVYLREKPTQRRIPEVTDSVSFEGSASITRRSIYLTLPGYVPVGSAYGVEEVDVALQVHAAGYQVLNCPWFRAWHERPYADYKHALVSWVKNEVLLAYLRYPRWLQPWGWLRAVRHVLNHWSPQNFGVLIRSLASSMAHCQQFDAFLRRYKFSEILAHHFRKPCRWAITEHEGNITVTTTMLGRRVLYLQYTNPAGYPPLQHSSQLLAARGWEVMFLGITGRGATAMAFPLFPRIQAHHMKWCGPGLKQKLHYIRFVLWCGWMALKLKPDWVYCSDPLSASPGLLVKWLTKAKVVYHEHDSPAAPAANDKWFARFSWARRAKLASQAEAVVLPNQARLDHFASDLSLTGKRYCVWNCPSCFEVSDEEVAKASDGPLRVLYHGSIVPERFPLMMIAALADCQRNVSLRLIGYEVPGMIGYTDQLRAEAVRLGVADRFEYLGTLPQRSDLMARAAECDVGLSLLQYRSADINMRHMSGASNKPFDYLSQGLALIVPIEPEWEQLFVASGCAKSCEPGNQEQLAALLTWMADHRDEVRAMGRRGQELIRTTWNYEAQFEPLLQLMENGESNSA